MPIKIRRGLDLPISGVPDQMIDLGAMVKSVAIRGSDYVGMKPTMLVHEGDSVKLGQPLFEDKKNPGVLFTSPGAGKVVSINRGEKRVFQSVVVELEGEDQEKFQSYANSDLTRLDRDAVVENLLKSGLWPSLRRRPYSKTPAVNEVPHAIFVQAIDTLPLAAFPGLILDENPNFFRYGLQVLSRLTEGQVHVCASPGFKTPGADPEDTVSDRVKLQHFEGPHPAGLPGTHIHKISAASEARPVWHINYQDTIAIGKLFATGELSVERVISLAGPQVKKPRLIRTRVGASIEDLTADELADGENRIISGSVLNGSIAEGPFAYLGRYDLQVSVLKEGRDRELLGWQMPGFNKYSVMPVYASASSVDGRAFEMTTNRNGSFRAIVPIGVYEKVMPLDIEPTALVKALLTGDTDQAQLLGATELDEEDVALLTFVDPGKHNFGPALRDILTRIEREG
ncbi:Na(+)-translocating NADH-quinone reductase subunit A [Thalassoglobus polymorphus]|uniref:Na(+)-translocating NADH-quinone reductase subunit A n=1 Tax=Thalassoglobus polymorphus TaxID=2527994 RepID=A0A517QNK8_9PLAN|nr:Na(+)-translocating NADH-quinone reductase subunit A [Thalassoglobus polymorphus]QDT33195.1 Na(+)-translocating NADH-quinone reductase subunit A [Thalassoglobus polymorphus]